jgi:hypothetical protein
VEDNKKTAYRILDAAMQGERRQPGSSPKDPTTIVYVPESTIAKVNHLGRTVATEALAQYCRKSGTQENRRLPCAYAYVGKVSC